MDRPKLEVADVFRRYGKAYREQHGASMSAGQRRVMNAIEVCRTAVLGARGRGGTQISQPYDEASNGSGGVDPGGARRLREPSCPFHAKRCAGRPHSIFAPAGDKLRQSGIQIV